MKQRATKMLSWLLVLCMLVGILPMAALAAENSNAVEFKAQQLSLSDDLTMKFYVSVGKALAESAVMQVSAAGNTKEYALKGMTPGADGSYLFSVNLAAAQMTEDITLTLTNGGEAVTQRTYSVQDYAHALLKGDYSDETKQMVKNVLNYGAKAQLYFDYKADDLANAGYELTDAAAVPAEVLQIGVEGALENVSFYGASLVFENKIAVRFYFTASEGVQGYTFVANAKSYTAQAKDALYYVEIPDINPQDMDKTVELTVSDGTGSLKIGYSPLHYITRMYNKAGTAETLKNLVQAMYGYHLAAVAYTGLESNYNNGVTLDQYLTVGTLFANDYAESVDNGAARSGYYGPTTALEDGWLRLTSTEHLFTFGRHTWAIFGGVDMAKNTTYKASFDLKLGAADANKSFNLYVMNDAGNDPRFGTVVKTLTLNFADSANLVTANTDDFAKVTYDRQTGIAHIEAVFTTHASVNTELVSKSAGTNNWLMDNLKFEQVTVNADYNNGISFADEIVEAILIENDFSSVVEKSTGKAGFNGSTATLEDGWARVTSTEHIFTFGCHTWGIYGGVNMAKNTPYKMSFDLKVGAADANKTFNLYVMTEKSGADPRWGDTYKTLVLNFKDLANLVTTNTDDFASVTYTAATQTAHIEILFKTDAAVNTNVVSRCAGNNNWLMDNLKVEKIGVIKNYDNGISFSDKIVESVLFENDFSTDANKGVTQSWHKSPFYGSTAVLEDGWVRLTSSEHVFVYGGHNYGNYGGFGFEKATPYKMSFDLKLGASTANKTFTLYVTTENGDPRFGNIVKTLTLNFDDIDNLVTTNTGDFASVVYDGKTYIAHIEILFTTDASVKTQVVSRCAGTNNWMLDNLKFEKIGVIKNYDNGISFADKMVESVLLENDYSEVVDKGTGRTAYWGPTATLDNGWLRLTSTEHLFTFGRHAWGAFGSADMAKDTTYKMSFDLKLGESSANNTFTLYVMTEKSGQDPRFGNIVKTLTLNFADIENLVTTNTDNFASVVYDGETFVAHIEILFTTDASANTQVVSRCAGTNNWLLDNLKFEKIGVPKNYDNGISHNNVSVISTLFENDFSENADKGVTEDHHRTSFYGSTVELKDGWLHLTSTEHLFVYGMHTWGQFGGVGFTMGSAYKMSFDLKLGDIDANKTFNLYVAIDNGDPRYGAAYKTLSLNFDDIDNFVTNNTGDFASVKYDAETKTAHIEILFTADASVNTQVISRCGGKNNWLLDNLLIQEVTTISNPLSSEGVLLKSFDYSDVTLQDGLYKETFDGCLAYYDQLSADDILYRWRKDSGMDTKTGRDLGWESGTTNPECCLAQLISYKARLYAITGDAEDLQLVKDILNGYQEIVDTTGRYPQILHAYFYEKTLRALLDCYEYCGLEQGYEMAKAFVAYGMKTDMFAYPSKQLGDNGTEWYTMGEALYMFAALAKSKGESTAYVNQCMNFADQYMYIEFWNIFYTGSDLFDYSVQVDRPYNEWFHAYSHVNSLNSAMEAYVQTGNSFYLTAAENFYQWAKNNQKLVTGGYGVQHEWLLPSDEMVDYLRTSASSTETQCNAYAIVNLDNRLMTVTGNATYGQWTEDAFYNMTIASLETIDGCPHYYSDYSSDGGMKYLRTDWPWACCAGTRPLVVMEYLKNIYFHDTQNLYVNLYTNSSVMFENKNGNQVTLSQNSNFPVEDTITFTVNAANAEKFVIAFRQPQWLASDAVVMVNGTAVKYFVHDGWIAVDRVWSDGDVITLKLPMELRYSVIEKASDATDCVYAITYGPVVLACTGARPTLRNDLPLNCDLNSLLTRQAGTLHFTVKSNSSLVLKPYYEYEKSEKYTLYISSQ